MLAEANTIQKAKDLKNLALTAADWARRVGAGEAAIQHAKAYAFEAEHRMGTMLAETERAPAGRPGKISRDTRPINKPQTLSEIGITKDESSRAQKIAALPDETFEKVKAGEIPISKAIKESQDDRYHDPASIPIYSKPEKEDEDEKDSPNLVGLKRYFRQATKKDRIRFIKWIKQMEGWEK